jgi:magnesium transporter
MTTVRSEARLQQSLAEISRLLAKHRVLDTMTQKLEGPRRDLLEHLQHQQNVAELQRRLRSLHIADIAYVLEALPPDDRRVVWERLEAERAGQVFVEMAPAIRESIVDFTSRADLIAVLETLEPDDLGFVAESLPQDVVDVVSLALEAKERTVFEESIQYPEGSVGYHMTRDWVPVHESESVRQVFQALRQRAEERRQVGAPKRADEPALAGRVAERRDSPGDRGLPPQTDRLFVVDARHVLRGDIPLQSLIVADMESSVGLVMHGEPLSFSPHDNAAEAAKSFERYDLVSAPVVDERGKLIGRLTVEAVMDVIRDESELRALKHAGLSGDEDLFAAPWSSARNRWPWLAVNLVTAFLASRVIGQFEGVIQQLAALAALMPIVASIGGNTGNQTMALVIRGLALDRIQASGTRRLLAREMAIAVMNGAMWGLVVGVFALALYADPALGLVMACAVVLNLVVAAIAGVVIPMALQTTGRDPARGSSVLLTFTTDAGGFFLFLGLANVFLV